MSVLEQFRPPWWPQAACLGLGVEAWFPADGRITPHVRRICIGCTVRTDCLLHALERPELQGVWGGTTELDRDRLRRQRL